MIKLQCACGHMLELPPALAGKQVRCMRCNKVLKVTGGATTESGRLSASGSKPRLQDQALVVQGTRPCPGCGTMYAPAIVVCVGCGLNVDSGAMLYASLDEDAQSPAAGARSAPGPRSLWQRLKGALGLGGKRS